MKLFVFGLVFVQFALTPLVTAHAQEKSGDGWISLDRDIQALAAGKLPTSLAIYDVRDIAESIGEEPGDAPIQERRRPVTMTRTVMTAEGPGVTEVLDPVREFRIECGTPLLAEILKTNLEPAFDAKLESINVAGPGSLAIVATKPQHEWLVRFFKLAQRTTDLVQIETRWISGPRGSFEKLGLTSSSTLPTKEEFAALLEKLEQDRAGTSQFDQLIAPTLVARNLQRAMISALDQIAYVKEWHVTFVQPGPQEIADPVIETINAGEMLELRTVRIEENLYRLALEIEHVAVAQPIPTKKVRVSVAPGGEAEVGLPNVTRVKFSADVKLASGAAAVLVTPLDDKRDLALMIKLSAVPNETPAAPTPERK